VARKSFVSSLLATWLSIALIVAFAEWRARHAPTKRPNLCSFCGHLAESEEAMRRHVERECDLHPAHRLRTEVQRVHGEMKRIYAISEVTNDSKGPEARLAVIHDIAGSNF
jgi:hypothetical protein